MNESANKAVVLLSGGLDSATVAAVAKSERYRVYALTFRYGQRHRFELDAAARVAAAAGVEDHVVLDIDLRAIGGSALTGDGEVPKGRSLAEIGGGTPITYVPARNTIFLSFALAWAEVLECTGIFVGVNRVDYSGYPDCRPEYVAAFEQMANLATRFAVEEGRLVRIHTPLINLTKAEIIKRGMTLGVDYSLTSTCYDPAANGVACGTCDACLIRLKGFAEAGLRDPIIYRDSV